MASLAIFGQPETKCLINPPKLVKVKLPAELMRMVQPAFAVQARHRDSPRESDSPGMIHYALFRLCLQIRING